MDQGIQREMKMPRFVVDASVIVKWVLRGEPYQEKALRLKEDHISGLAELCAPSFLVQEVANALWRAIKLGRISEVDAREALLALNDMRIDLHDVGWAETSEGLGIAHELDLTVYDVSYLLLTDEMEAPLITVDQKLIGKAEGRFRILHLKDY